MKPLKQKLILVLLVGIASCLAAHAQIPAALMYDPAVKSIQFAANDVKAALEQNGHTVTELPLVDPSAASQTVRVILTTQGVSVPGMPSVTGLAKEGYAIRRVVDGLATNLWVIGFDAPGVMYGGLELAEAVKLADGLTGVTDRQNNPHIGERGIKFNIPLDARTPSYSDDSSSAQPNIANMWDESFWISFFDNMARHRYNMLSLWSLHPFPSMVRVPEYPNVALADVKQNSGALWNASLLGTGMYDPSWTLTTVKTMTVEEKIAFWRWVMQYAKDRGIDLYVFTWNIFTYGTEPSGYGITDSHTNATTKDYFRKSVKALFNTYPLLKGVGITAGENMENMTSDEEEQWLYDTYGLGVSDALADAENPQSPYYSPGRLIRLIHRAHFADLNKIITYFQGLPGANNPDSTLSFSFKYSQAHMHSSTKPQFIYQSNWFNTIPAGKKVYLTVRNDDMYNMRWGDPDFARAYLTNFPDRSKIAGFYMGPDGYTWGREYLSTEPDTPRQLVIDKMWYSFLLYGRLSYDPTIPNSRFQAILGERFPEVSSSNLFQGWASTSKILPLLTRFYWGALDFQWYPEACWSSSGFRTVQNFIDPQYDPMQASEDGDRPLLMSVKQFVDGEAVNGRLTPLDVADLLQQYADNGKSLVETLNPGTNKELRLTLGDINAMAWLGRYYAAKIRGAVDLYRHQRNSLASDHANARTHLIAASNHWSQYAALSSSQYVQQTLTRMGLTSVNIAAIQEKVNADIPPALLPTTPENLPWIEDFNLPTGTNSDGAPTSWQATRGSGPFEANVAGKLFINGSGGEGVFTSAPIHISGNVVNLSLDVLGAGGLDASGTSQDHLRLFVKINGGPETPVQQITGPLAAATWTSNGITGNTLQVIVRALVTADSEFYYLDNLRVEAQQNVTTYTLTTSATNGTIALNPSGGVYPAGAVVDVTALPNNGYAFSSWSGDLSGFSSSTSITMDGNKNITANFVSVPTYILTVNASNGTVQLNPPGGVYSEGTSVSLTPVPNNGFTFASWSGALIGSSIPGSITMDANKSVTANFNAIPIAPTSPTLVANYTFDTGTVSGTTVTSSVNSPAYNGTLSASSGLIDTTAPLSGSGSLQVSGGSRMTIAGTSGILDGWKAIDVQGRVNLSSLTGQHSLINVGHAGNTSGSATRFRLTVRDGGKIFVGLRFGASTGDTFMGYYAGSATGDLLLSANTTYDIGVFVDATGASSSIPGKVKIRYKLATDSAWTYPTAFLSTASTTIAGWANGWTGASLGAGVGSLFGGAGEPFTGKIDNLTISNMTHSYISWIGGFNVGSLVAPSQDPDNDGVANSLENLFGTRPNEFSRGVEAVGQSGNVFTFTHPIAASQASDLSFFYEWSTDLENWHDSGQASQGVEVSINPSIANDTATVTATVTNGSTPKLMVRARATQR